MSQPYAAGSLYSTVDDLYKWDQALYTDKVMSAASKERVFTPGLSNYGYGWIIRQQDGVTTIEHGGGINGFNTFLSRNPDSKRLIVLLNNTGGAPLDAIGAGVRAILNGKEPVAPRIPAAPLLFKTYQSSGLAAALAQSERAAIGQRVRRRQPGVVASCGPSAGDRQERRCPGAGEKAVGRRAAFGAGGGAPGAGASRERQSHRGACRTTHARSSSVRRRGRFRRHMQSASYPHWRGNRSR